jgi:hypothetical protein
MGRNGSAKIIEIKPTHPYKHPRVKFSILPQHEFAMLIVAPKGSGKTNLICNLLLNHYKGYFHKIIVCSPTVLNDPKWEVIKSTKGILTENKALAKIIGEPTEDDNKLKRVPRVVHKNDEQAMEHEKKKSEKFDGKIPENCFITDMKDVPKLLQEQLDVTNMLHDKGFKEKAKFLIDRVLVIEDDQAGLYQGGTTNNPQVNLTFKHRHFGASLIKVTQAYKAMPKSIRVNMDSLAAFEIPNQAELEVLYEEWPMYLPKDEWMQVFKYATQEPFSFIYMTTKKPKGQRIYKNFEYLIDISE